MLAEAGYLSQISNGSSSGLLRRLRAFLAELHCDQI